MDEIPLGFSMALVQQPHALRLFTALDTTTQQAIIRRAASISSKEEMDELVASITKYQFQ